MAAAAEGMEFFTNAVPLWRALPQLRGWLHAKVTVVQRGVGGGGNSKHHSLFTPDKKKQTKQNLKKVASKPSRFIHDIWFQFHRFATFDLLTFQRPEGQWSTMISNRSQANVGLVFLFSFAPLQQDFTSFMLTCDSSDDRMTGQTPSVPTSTKTPTVSYLVHRHIAFASVYLGGDCKGQLLWPPLSFPADLSSPPFL